MPENVPEKPAQAADLSHKFTQYLRSKNQPRTQPRKTDRNAAQQDPEDRLEDAPNPEDRLKSHPKRGAESAEQPGAGHEIIDDHKIKRQKSPPQTPRSPVSATSPNLGPRDSPSSTRPAAGSNAQRSRNRAPAADSGLDFEAAPREHKSLWQDGSPGMTRQQQASQGGPSRSNVRGQQQQQQQATERNNPRFAASGLLQRRGGGPKGGGRAGAGVEEPLASNQWSDTDRVNKLEKQPNTHAISQEQLVTEVKGIYAGLVMVENKCIEVDTKQNLAIQDPASPALEQVQWRALIVLHRTLLHEHHDFFLASQHPSASPALQRLASKYAMPARMWRHGIHSFLELLRHRLPESLEYMLTFIYLAYSMMALLYETVPAFKYTWIECLGDLSRYRMAIEDDTHDREIWTNVSRHWYSQASDQSPTTGRLYHHLAILARPNVVAQLYYYAKSLCVPIPFGSARDSILTLFDPIMNGTTPIRLRTVDRALIKCHGIFFTRKLEEQIEAARIEFFSNLDLSIAKAAERWLEPGYQVAISNLCGLFDYGAETNILMKALAASAPERREGRIPSEESKPAALEAEVEDEHASLKRYRTILQFAENTDAIVLARLGDVNILSYLNVRLMFLYQMATLKGPDGAEPQVPAMAYLESSFPWQQLTSCLNSFAAGFESPEKYKHGQFPWPSEKRPLPEDWAMRGLSWAVKAFPEGYFTVDNNTEDDEKTFETPSMGDQRRERCLWLAYQIAQIKAVPSENEAEVAPNEDGVEGRWIIYDSQTKSFRPAAKYISKIEFRPPLGKSVTGEAEPSPAEKHDSGDSVEI